MTPLELTFTVALSFMASDLRVEATQAAKVLAACPQVYDALKFTPHEAHAIIALGTDMPLCQHNNIGAMASGPYILVCPLQWVRVKRSDRVLYMAHEMLHVQGLPENPTDPSAPFTSLEITQVLQATCFAGRNR